MPKVFISHSTKDRARVEREIVALLNGHGIDTWYSRDDIQTADNWERTIARGLEACEWFLLAMSPHSAQSEWVKDEVHWAIDVRPGKIIPVLIDACDPRAFHLRLARIQYVDFTRELPSARLRLLAIWGVTPLSSEGEPIAAVTPASPDPPAVPAPMTKPPSPPRLVKVSEAHRFEGHRGAITAVAVSPDGRLALSGGRDGKVHLWDLAARKERQCLTTHAKPVGRVLFFPDGRRILSSSADGTVRVANLDTGREVRAFEQTANWAVALSPDGKRALSGHPTGNDLLLWEVESGKELHRLAGHTEPVRGVAFAPSGYTALSSGRDQTIRYWDLASGKQLHSFTVLKASLTTICFAPNGQSAWSGNGQAISRWDPGKGREIGRLEGHGEGVVALATSADGRWLVSAAADETVRLWDVENTSEAACLRGHTGEVSAVDISADGQQIISGGEDRILRLWHVKV
jgi:WD40 repeat protein